MIKFKLPFRNHKSKIDFKNLKKFNLTMAGLHAIQALVLLLIADSYTLPVTTGYLTVNESTQHLEPATRSLVDVPIVWMVALFLFTTAIAHLIVATFYRKKYEADINSGVNKVRWFDYAISGGAMMVVIALLVGVYDLSLLITIFGLSVIASLMGLVMELWNQNAKQTNWISFIGGCFAGAIQWAVLLIYILGAVIYGDKGAPGFVYIIYLTMLVLFSLFAINSYLHYKKIGPWRSYRFVESGYMILSMAAKAALAWQVFAGVLT